MKLLFVIGLIATAAASISVAQVKNASGKAEREIRQVEEKRREALLRGDTTTLDQIFADEYIVTNQSGGVRTKTQMISDLRSGALKFESADEDDVVVRVYGNTAVITGRATSKHEGRDSTQVRFTRVYVKRMGRWQAVTYQVTRIAQQ